MSAELLLGHFDRLAEAPGAVPRLRRFILDLAVRGKLVPQDPREDPIEDPVSSSKDDHVRRKSLPALGLSITGPFALPASWIWVRFGDIAEFNAGRTPSRNETAYWNGADYGWVSIADMPDGGTISRTKERISEKARAIVFGREPEPPGTMLMSFKLTIGKIARLGIPAFHNEAIIAIRPRLSGIEPFLFKVLPQFSRGGATKGAIKGATLNRESLGAFVLPLPPVKEQQRIVAKIDELMSLCDRMEAAQTERERRRDQVVAISVGRTDHLAEGLLPSPSSQLLIRAFDGAIRARHIDTLRDAFMELGVTGGLTDHLPDDGSAESLLRTLPRWLRRDRNTSGVPTTESGLMPQIPDRWARAIIDDLASPEPNAITDGPFGANLKTEHYVSEPGCRVVRLQNIARRTFRNEHRSYISAERFERLTKHHVSAGDLLVAGLVDPFVRCCRAPSDIGPALVKADCYRFKVDPRLSADYLCYYLNSPLAGRLASIHHHGMTLIRLGLGNFRQLPVLLPPLAEQERIVIALDALMSVCDRLETGFTNTGSLSVHLLDALLHEALETREIRPVLETR